MKWTFNQPKQAGWYWVKYPNYEYAEVVFWSGSEVYAAGQQLVIQPKNILAWSNKPIELPE